MHFNRQQAGFTFKLALSSLPCNLDTFSLGPGTLAPWSHPRLPQRCDTFLWGLISLGTIKGWLHHCWWLITLQLLTTAFCLLLYKAELSWCFWNWDKAADHINPVCIITQWEMFFSVSALRCLWLYDDKTLVENCFHFDFSCAMLMIVHQLWDLKYCNTILDLQY